MASSESQSKPWTPEPPEGRRLRAASRALLLAALAAYTLFLVQHAARGVGGTDSSGYANTARQLLAGTLVDRPRALDRLGLPDEMAPAFIPIGFVPGPTPGTMAPLYPVGFPAHLALAAWAAGWDAGPFWVSPIAAALCLLLTYRIGRELRLSRLGAAGAAAVVGAWATFVFQALQPMSDVVATLWCLAAILSALLARRRPYWAVAAGAAFGIAVLVRPTDALLAVPLFFALPPSPRARLGFLGGAAPALGLLAAYDVHCYGAAWKTGWEEIGLLRSMRPSNFPPRFRSYSRWLAVTLTPLVPLGWLSMGAARRAPPRDRALLLTWFGAFLGFYCLYGPYESFLFLRFLLPGYPALPLGAFLAVRAWTGPSRRSVVAPLAGAVLAAAVLLVEVWSSSRIGIVSIVADEGSTYPSVCRWLERRTPERSVVVGTYASGALEYYTNRVSLRWDPLSPARFASLRSTLEDKGYRFYALLFPEEERELIPHAPGPWRRVGELRRVGLWELPPGSQ